MNHPFAFEYRRGSRRESWLTKMRPRLTTFIVFVPLPNICCLDLCFVPLLNICCQIPRCTRANCGGVVKPDIVFFGEGLPDHFHQVGGEFRNALRILFVDIER